MKDRHSEVEEQALEEAVGRVLRALPSPKAPPTLLARVMAEVADVHLLPWYRAGWLSWPILWQAASLVLAGALVSGAFLGGPLLLEVAGNPEGGAGGAFADLLASVYGVAAILRIGSVVVGATFGAIPSGAIAAGAMSAFLMVAITVAGGTVLRRLSLDREIYT